MYMLMSFAVNVSSMLLGCSISKSQMPWLPLNNA